MLICKNCDSENLDGAVKCHHCKMEDSLVYLKPKDQQFDVVVVDHNPLACPNCACESPGEGEKCVECHFPNANHRKQNGRPLPHPHSSLLERIETQNLSQT